MRPLTTLQELVEATGGHPVAVLDVGAGFVAPAYAVGTGPDATVAFHRRSDHGVPGSAAIGTASGLAALLDAPEVRSWVTGDGNRHLSVPRGLVGVVQERLDLGSRGGEWDWMWTRHAPPVVPGEEQVAELEASTRDEAEAFLTAHSPRTHGQPFARAAQRWVGVRDPDSGALVALGGSEPSAGGTPTLAGIAVATDRRGEGWGAAVTAHLTRLAVTETGACALGMFADNAVARRVYQRLGFITGMEWTSRWFG
ncbi:MAG TPA: GNAT family N-acetyltransferase [Ornithinibacter sp.]|nr:GNAT family N-acetyltransferase [Ornithinibacter sp.]